jgi:hypothetical protein
VTSVFPPFYEVQAIQHWGCVWEYLLQVHQNPIVHFADLLAELIPIITPLVTELADLQHLPWLPSLVGSSWSSGKISARAALMQSVGFTQFTAILFEIGS